LHGNNVRDEIIAHVISADAQIYRCGNSKVILGPAGRARFARGQLVKTLFRKVEQSTFFFEGGGGGFSEGNNLSYYNCCSCMWSWNFVK